MQFLSLPNEVVRMLFVHLSFKQREGVSRVCKLWNFLIHAQPELPIFDELDLIAFGNVQLLTPYLIKHSKESDTLNLMLSSLGDLDLIKFESTGFIKASPPGMYLKEESQIAQYIWMKIVKTDCNAKEVAGQPYMIKECGIRLESGGMKLEIFEGVCSRINLICRIMLHQLNFLHEKFLENASST